jgi:hypothetical protein
LTICMSRSALPVRNTPSTKRGSIKQLRLVQFDGTPWQPIGDVIESAFVNSTNR